MLSPVRYPEEGGAEETASSTALLNVHHGVGTQ